VLIGVEKVNEAFYKVVLFGDEVIADLALFILECVDVMFF
jgi:hypothetical protein